MLHNLWDRELKVFEIVFLERLIKRVSYISWVHSLCSWGIDIVWLDFYSTDAIDKKTLNMVVVYTFLFVINESMLFVIKTKEKTVINSYPIYHSIFNSFLTYP